MNPVALRLLNQQLVAPQFAGPAEVVSHLGAIQAQEYRMMRWAVAMRTSKPSVKAFKEAYDNGRIIRLHLMRGTWQLDSSFYRFHGYLSMTPENIRPELMPNLLAEKKSS